MNSTALCTAACLELNSMTAYPPTTSFVSVNGPSSSTSFPAESRTRELIAVGVKPPLAMSLPSFVSCALSLAIASISSRGGAAPFSADFTNIMNRIWYRSCSRLLLLRRTAPIKIDIRTTPKKTNCANQPEKGELGSRLAISDEVDFDGTQRDGLPTIGELRRFERSQTLLLTVRYQHDLTDHPSASQ